jgi:serine/threonine protein kinase/tetratricopeptide (TPR) repeat protein
VLERGAAIGRFFVLGLLGKGGMGEVYAAHDPELDRKVAIKLLRAGAASESPEGRLRLMREAQAIARVSHPSVVVVYDVGMFGERVFIAMELVEGHTLRFWAHAQHRPWPAVVDVFAAAGRGLAAAHERDLVHRDFKPDNVMITADGKVRVMDFGLVQMRGDRTGATPLPTAAAEARRTPSGFPAARPSLEMTEEDLLVTRPSILATTTPSSQPGGAIGLELTRDGTSMGTPAYMSPEQFRNQPTDARTDQFSFCVSLYETIYSERPFAGTNEAALADAVINEHVRSAPPGSDVPDWVRAALLRGLRADPDQRWPSMNALLDTLDKHPAIESRRRFLAAATDKLAGVWHLPGGAALDTLARREMRRAFLASGRSYAGTAFDHACAILDRYAQRWAQLYVESCEATHVRAEQSAEVLDLRMACLQEGLQDLAALVRMFRQATAAAVDNAVNAANALGNLERCENIELLRAVVRPPTDAATRERVESLRQRLADVRARGRVGRIAEALTAMAPLATEARAIGYGPLLADVLHACARLHEDQGATEEAARFSEEAFGIAVACRHDEAAAEIATLMVGYTQLRPIAADTWTVVAEALLRRIGGHDQLWGWFYNNRGIVRSLQGRPEESLEDQYLALRAKEKVLQPDHPDIAVTVCNIAIRLDDAGRLDEAIELGRRAVEIGEAGFGGDHPRTALFLANYSELLAHSGRGADSALAAARALDIVERQVNPDSVLVFVALTSLGIARLMEGKNTEALAALERADRLADSVAPSSAYRAQVRFALGRALWESGRDRAKALALAATARQDYEAAATSVVVRQELGQIAAWLAERAAAPIAARPPLVASKR